MISFIGRGRLRKLVQAEVEKIRTEVTEHTQRMIEQNRPEACPGCGCKGIQIHIGIMNYVCGSGLGPSGFYPSNTCKARQAEIYRDQKGIAT